MSGVPLVIRGRHRLPRWMRLRDVALTAAMWAVYAALLRELFVLLAGWVGLAPDADVERYLAKALALLPTLAEYAGAIAVNAALLLGWALYNQLRFRGRDTRRVAPPVETAELAASFGLDLPDLERLRHARRMLMLHAPDGRLLSVATELGAAPTLNPTGHAAAD
jgi:biofilm PGA synthesis protein PgaD